MLSKPALPAPAATADDWLDMACIRCNAITRHRLVRGRWECVPCEERDKLYAKWQQQAIEAFEAERRAVQGCWYGWQSAASNPFRFSCWSEVAGEDWWRRYGLLVIVGLILLAIAIVKLRRRLASKPAVVAKGVAMPVREGFVLWVPKP